MTAGRQTAPAPAAGGAPGERVLRRNVAVGTLGLAARGAHVFLLLAVGRTLGAAALGQLLVGLALFEVAAAVAATGFTDGTLVLVSRRAGTEGASRVVVTGLLVGGAWRWRSRSRRRWAAPPWAAWGPAPPA